MAELIISSNAPCCPPKGTLWRDPLNKALKVLDQDRESVGGCCVASVNNKTGVVKISAEEILGRAAIANSVYTSNGWAEAVASPIQGSKSLITSGGVYLALEALRKSVNTIQATIGTGAAASLKKTDVEQTLSNLSTDQTVPSSGAVLRYLSQKMVQGGSAITVNTQGDTTTVSANDASRSGKGVVRYATQQDYENADGMSVITPDLIKPLVDELKEKLDGLATELANTKQELNTTKQDLLTLRADHTQLKQDFNNYKATHP